MRNDKWKIQVAVIFFSAEKGEQAAMKKIELVHA